MTYLADNKNIDDKYHKTIAKLSQEKSLSELLLLEIRNKSSQWFNISIFCGLLTFILLGIFSYDIAGIVTNSEKGRKNTQDVEPPVVRLFEDTVLENYIYDITLFVLIVSLAFSTYKYFSFIDLSRKLSSKIHHAENIHEKLIEEYNNFKYT